MKLSSQEEPYEIFALSVAELSFVGRCLEWVGNNLTIVQTGLMVNTVLLTGLYYWYLYV